MSDEHDDSQATGDAPGLTIWVDADACPVALKEILIRAAKRLALETVFVANAQQRIPMSKLFRQILVPSGADRADRKIVELLRPGDLVITADIPLAAAAMESGAIALGTRGELFDEHSVGERLAMRNVMDQIRSAGVETGGPRPLNNKDVQAFANQLDRILTKMTRK